MAGENERNVRKMLTQKVFSFSTNITRCFGLRFRRICVQTHTSKRALRQNKRCRFQRRASDVIAPRFLIYTLIFRLWN